MRKERKTEGYGELFFSVSALTHRMSLKNRDLLLFAKVDEDVLTGEITSNEERLGI